MNNFGGTILAADQWQIAIPANPSRTLATVQNNNVRSKGADGSTYPAGPFIDVWAYPADPTAGNRPAGYGDGCFTLRPADPYQVSGTASMAAIWVRGPKGATFAASEY